VQKTQCVSAYGSKQVTLCARITGLKDTEALLSI